MFCLSRRIGVALRIVALLLASFLSAPVSAQGLATWVGDKVGLGDAGRALDDANRQAKEVVPLYGQTEEAVTGFGRHLITEATVEAAAPLLKNMILMSRQDALNAGAGPLPPEVVWEFSGFYAPNVLATYWRIGQGHELSLQANSFRFGDKAAIALDTVLVFRSLQDVYSPWLWAHELAHIEQYRAWGIDDFAKRYIRNNDEIEVAANRRADEFMAFRARRFAQIPTQQTGPQNGGICVTAVNSCAWVGPVGWNCVCASPVGLQQGVIR